MSQAFDPHSTRALATDIDSGELRERSFRLSVVEGVDKGREATIEEGPLRIGTHPDNDLVLTDDTVSRHHLQMDLRPEGLLIKDLGSTNGTVHGGTRLGQVTVATPTRLRVGKHTQLEIIPIDKAVDLGAFDGNQFGNVLGISAPIRQLFALLSRVAPTDATVLLEGETGTGKEAIAEAIHLESPRAGKPYVIVDCAAIPANLIGSELFGHVKGAFTGAQSDKAGLIESADGGTVFLDEIGELSIDLQPQLLRVLEKREVRRIGDTKTRSVDIRVVAATNRDLRKMVDEGTFREDLYYRLAVVKTRVPPLRERPDDIPILAHHFAGKVGGRAFDLSPTLIEELKRHDWPGNVRELRNVVERALSLGQVGLPQTGKDLVGGIAAGGSGRPYARSHNPEEVLDLPFKEAKGQLIESFERDYITQLLKKHKGNISQAANEAGIDRNYIHRLVKKYNLTVDRG
jgi:transcriptional regulator with PAS, ATPase and Fis domain